MAGVSKLLTKYVIFALCANICLTIINCLFVLNSGDAVLPIIGFFGKSHCLFCSSLQGMIAVS